MLLTSKIYILKKKKNHNVLTLSNMLKKKIYVMEKIPMKVKEVELQPFIMIYLKTVFVNTYTYLKQYMSSFS